MGSTRTPRLRLNYLAASLAVCMLLAIGASHILTPSSSASQLGNRSLKLSSSQVSATAQYELAFNISSPGTLGSIRLQFCSNDPFPGNSCVAPGGLDASAAVLDSQTGTSGFSILPGPNANEIILTRLPSSASAGAVSFSFSGITNPSSSGSYFARVETFASVNATGLASNDGGIAFAINNLIEITATVPPYLIFCTGVTIANLNCANATGDYIDFGELSSGSARSGSSQMLVATNALSGYGITVSGTTLTSGNNQINNLLANDVSRPGTPQFGFNLRANVAPAVGRNPAGPGVSAPQPAYNQPNSYRFVSGETIVSNAVPDDIREYTASYIVNVPNTQPAGVYVATLTYICLASF